VAAQNSPVAPSTSKDVYGHSASPLLPNPGFEKIKSLAGNWEGTYGDGKGKSVMNFRVVSNGSAVMLSMDEATKGEMITVFHPDGTGLIATHYCAARNQPRMQAVASSNPNVLRFEFKDISNLPDARVGHMQALTLTMLDPDHHIQEWTFVQDGKQETGRFEVRRVR
jgi:hypothetical protein